jgi:acylphosphatase
MIRGRVQAVGFRAFVEEAAEEQHLQGWVRNRRDGSVEAVFAGREDAVEAVIEACHTGPPAAKVDAVDVDEGTPAMLDQRPKNVRFAVLPTG